MPLVFFLTVLLNKQGIYVQSTMYQKSDTEFPNKFSFLYHHDTASAEKIKTTFRTDNASAEKMKDDISHRDEKG